MQLSEMFAADLECGLLRSQGILLGAQSIWALTQLGANLDSTKGVDLYRQQDGGHESQNQPRSA